MLLVPLAIGLIWAKFTDLVKEQNPLADFITSAALKDWNFGTLAQRLDGNFWYGGRTSLGGVENPSTLQQSSRIGITASVPITRHQAIKLGVADGAYVRFGGDYTILSVAWQYSWVGKP